MAYYAQRLLAEEVESDTILSLRPNPGNHAQVIGRRTAPGAGAAASLWIRTEAAGEQTTDYGQIRFVRGDKYRWKQGFNLDASGDDNYHLRREADDSVPLTEQDVFVINRVTRVVDFKVTPTVNGVAVGSGGGSYLPLAGGDVTGRTTIQGSSAGNPILEIYNSSSTGHGMKARANVSSRVSNQYALMAANGANSVRAFQVFADDSIVQVGPTPYSGQWPSGLTGAPTGSSGPVGNLNDTGGLYMYNGPVSGDCILMMVSNASLTGAGVGSGPNQQGGIGIVGANSQGRIRINYFGPSSDGGFRIHTNRYPKRTATGVGTVSLSGTTATFSTDQRPYINVGDAFWVDLPANSYSAGNPASLTEQGFTVLTMASNGLSATFTPTQNIGNPTGALTIKYVTGSPQADENRGSIKVGTDSSGQFFGFQYQQPVASSNVLNSNPVYWAGDFNFLIYPGGIVNNSNMGFSPFIDLVSIHPGRGIRIVTSDEALKGNYKVGLVCNAWYTSLPNTAGTIETNGKVKMQGGWTAERAPLRIVEQQNSGSGVGAPATAELEDGDMWRIGATLYLRHGSTTKSITFT